MCTVQSKCVHTQSPKFFNHAQTKVCRTSDTSYDTIQGYDIGMYQKEFLPFCSSSSVICNFSLSKLFFCFSSVRSSVSVRFDCQSCTNRGIFLSLQSNLDPQLTVYY